MTVKRKTKPKPVTLDRVTRQEEYGQVLGRQPNTTFEKWGETARKRFTVRARIPGLREVLGVHSGYMLWDKKLDARLFSTKAFRTRTAAWRYLKTTTVENREYKLEMLNQALHMDD